MGWSVGEETREVGRASSWQPPPRSAPRAGAVVLAVAGRRGAVFPVVAVQRYGQERSMVFGGSVAALANDDH
jgi:hypothetical protein